ncbi:Hypothetical protein HVR_LOCUS562 [uncultured virus]|nr:Hypothetical protein HVR_LOCUS562 [uncultured virus]
MSYSTGFIATPFGRTFQDPSIIGVPTYAHTNSQPNIMPVLFSSQNRPNSKFEISPQGVLLRSTSTSSKEGSSLQSIKVDPSGIIIQTRPRTYDELFSYSYDERGSDPSVEPVSSLPELRTTDVDPDPDFGISQEWLLNQRQGDTYDQIPERNEGYPEENDPAFLYQWTNEAPTYEYNQLPNLKVTPITGLDEEYLRLLEYADEQSKDLEDKSIDTYYNQGILVQSPITPTPLSVPRISTNSSIPRIPMTGSVPGVSVSVPRISMTGSVPGASISVPRIPMSGSVPGVSVSVPRIPMSGSVPGVLVSVPRIPMSGSVPGVLVSVPKIPMSGSVPGVLVSVPKIPITGSTPTIYGKTRDRPIIPKVNIPILTLVY